MGKQIIIGVPGYWETRAEILAAVANKSDGFLCLANTLSDYFYSCGMHNFDLPDVSTSPKLSPDAASKLMNPFNCFVLFENPTLVDGETFSVAASAPRYRLKRKRCELYHRDDPFYNPLGRWHLVQT